MMANLATGKAIKMWIRFRGTTIKALAEELEVSPWVLSKWINSGDIPPYAMKRMSKILRVPVEKLLGG